MVSTRGSEPAEVGTSATTWDVGDGWRAEGSTGTFIEKPSFESGT